MLSFILPLIIVAIALTPVVASAGATYKREVSDLRFSSDHDSTRNDSICSVELNRPNTVLVDSLGRR